MQRALAAADVSSLVVQRQLDVLDDGELRDQVVRLEDEAQVAAADLRQLVVVQLRDVLPAQDVLPARGPVEAAQQVEQRALARAGVPHDGDEISLGKIDRHAAQRAHHDPALEDIVLVHVDDAGGHFLGHSGSQEDAAQCIYSWRKASIGSICAARWPGTVRT